jgi:2-polyprenyl-3-methyl-5-hydroxy-6-metoxy-1,4-benzoquinol methylase
MSDGFSDADARDAWNQGADAWLHFARSGADYYRAFVHGPALLEACGEVAGRDVLDLGCGEGYFCRALASRGARVTGVELSDRMLEHARASEREEPLGIDYRRGSAAEIAGLFGDARFPLVTACMALHDMADVPAVLAAVHRVLEPEGRFVYSIPHPFSDMAYREWERDALRRKLWLRVDRYFESGRATTEWNMPRLVAHWSTPYWRMTLAESTGLLARAGFLIRRLDEPRPTPEQIAERPDLEDCSRVPFFLVVEAVKETSAVPGTR